jgi:FAD/FMN-containing dehydrogenase
MRGHRPVTAAEVPQLMKEAPHTRRSFSLSGGRHTMDGQQFCQKRDLLDTRGLNRILA